MIHCSSFTHNDKIANNKSYSTSKCMGFYEQEHFQDQVQR